MPTSRLSTALALAFVVISFSSSTVAVSCGVCGPSIFFQGLTRTLTSTRQDTGNAVYYDTPPISGIAPACVYSNVNGGLLVTNAGGACPSTVVVVQEASCPNF
ncbi:hypothetical protein C8R46DRAFT_1080933, partial [Mycena filopes]